MKWCGDQNGKVALTPYRSPVSDVHSLSLPGGIVKRILTAEMPGLYLTRQMKELRQTIYDFALTERWISIALRQFLTDLLRIAVDPFAFRRQIFNLPGCLLRSLPFHGASLLNNLTAA
jgi:hypothetical protein